jgi:hypothetical protein
MDMGFNGEPDYLNDFLGAVELEGKQLQVFLGLSCSQIEDFPLVPRITSAPNLDQKGIQGTVKLRGSKKGYEVTFFSAQDLINIDGKLYDKPYGLVLWNGDELARSMPDRKTSRDPVFNETFGIPNLSPSQKLEDMVMELQIWGTSKNPDDDPDSSITNITMGSVTLTGLVYIC